MSVNLSVILFSIGDVICIFLMNILLLKQSTEFTEVILSINMLEILLKDILDRKNQNLDL